MDWENIGIEIRIKNELRSIKEMGYKKYGKDYSYSKIVEGLLKIMHDTASIEQLLNNIKDIYDSLRRTS